MKNTSFILPPQVMFALERLDRCGFEGYVVGGCVRDMLMGRVPSDYDITTNARPEEIVHCFDGFTVYTQYLRHATVTAAIDGMNIEITSYRVDGDYSDSRHPDDVRLASSLKEDLSRRDFTINAVAYSPSAGIVDIFGGAEAIERRELCCVGAPEKRFSEDALRIMRAIRFSAQLDFTIEENTARAVHLYAPLLEKISEERLASELCKLLCGVRIFDTLCGYYDVLGVFIPELLPCVGFEQHSRYHIYDIWRHIAMAVQKADNDKIVRLAAFFHDIGKPPCFTRDEDGTGHFKGHATVSAEMSRSIMRRLRFSEADIKSVGDIIYRHSITQMNEKSIRRRLNELGEENFFRLIELQKADNSAKNEFCLERLPELERLGGLAREIIRRGECFSLSRLALNGRDMMALGLEGREIGAALGYLLQGVLDGVLVNERDALLDAINKRLQSGGLFTADGED